MRAYRPTKEQSRASQIKYQERKRAGLVGIKPSIPTEKTCSRSDCQETNPQPLSAFGVDMRASDERESQCLACKRMRSREQSAKVRAANLQISDILLSLEGVKSCSNPTCKQSNPQHFSEFDIQLSKPSGRRSHCKSCRAESYKADPHRENHIERRRDRYRANRAGMLERMRHNRLANIERIRAYDRMRGRRPERKAAKRIYNNRRWATQNNAPGQYTQKDIDGKLELQGGLCYYCFCVLETYHIEHKISLSKGGTNWPANLCCSCKRCNSQKCNRDFYEFLGWKALDNQAQKSLALSEMS